MILIASNSLKVCSTNNNMGVLLGHGRQFYLIWNKSHCITYRSCFLTNLQCLWCFTFIDLHIVLILHNSTYQYLVSCFCIWCPLGYVDIGLIPEGARNILIKEVAEAGNFLALRGDNPSRYFLNGGWTIQWTGEYKAAGATFTYERAAQLENLTSPGPTLEPLWIQVWWSMFWMSKNRSWLHDHSKEFGSRAFVSM